MPAPHPPEFRRHAVELARQGDKPPIQLAKDLGISRSCLQNWMTQADADEKGGTERLTSAEKRNSRSCDAVSGRCGRSGSVRRPR